MGTNEIVNKCFGRLGGVTPAVGEVFNPLSEKEIAEISSRFDFPLPSGIVAILLDFGACTFQEYVYCRPEFSEHRFLVRTFLGKCSRDYPKATAISLLEQLEWHQEDFDVNFLPFADDGGGDLFGVYLPTGNVLFWSHDDPDVEFQILSNSLEEWFNTLEN
jgi:SMI1 / KNR4 family (SUKH-1)